jgi:hypothetical protein
VDHSIDNHPLKWDLNIESLSAFVAAAAQRPPKVVKLHFFLMHAITTAHAFDVMLRQPWISTAVKVRLTGCMARLALAAYATAALQTFLLKEIVDYTPRYKDKADDPWEELVRQAIDVGDGGHAAKFARGLMHGQKVSAKYIVQR